MYVNDDGVVGKSTYIVTDSAEQVEVGDITCM